MIDGFGSSQQKSLQTRSFFRLHFFVHKSQPAGISLRPARRGIWGGSVTNSASDGWICPAARGCCGHGSSAESIRATYSTLSCRCLTRYLFSVRIRSHVLFFPGAASGAGDTARVIMLPALCASSRHARREAVHTDKSQTSRVVNPDLDLAVTRFFRR